MFFMLFMVKAASGMEPNVPTRFAQPNRQAGTPSATLAPLRLCVEIALGTCCRRPAFPFVPFVVLPLR